MKPNNEIVMITDETIMDEVRRRATKGMRFMQGGGRSDKELQTYKDGVISGGELAMSILRDKGILTPKTVDKVIYYVFNGRNTL